MDALSSITSELEALVGRFTSTSPTQSADEIDDASVRRWTSLFNYTPADARSKIAAHRADLLNPVSITDAIWDEFSRADKEPMGHDKESWEHQMQRVKEVAKKSLGRRSTRGPGESGLGAKGKVTGKRKGLFLMKLDGPLATPEAVKEAAGLSGVPKIFKSADTTDGATAEFCIVDGVARGRIEAFLEDKAYMPFFTKYSIAEKGLSPFSAYPTLGLRVDTTLPQHRANTSAEADRSARPEQNEYPVWYFFYGTLDEPERLKQMLALDHEPELTPASVRGGRLTTWAHGKYKGLVDGREKEIIVGSAFLVESEEQEDALRGYETERYEVVRVQIGMEAGEGSWVRVRGLTFRFAGE